MVSLRRLSLRRQQLAFFAVVTGFVLVLIAMATGVSARSSQLFGESLNRYFHIHQLRTGLSETHQDLELYLRRGDPDLLVSLDNRETTLTETYRKLASLGIRDRSSRFELNAVFYGLRAYRTAALRAIREYDQDNGGYYFSLAYAERIRTYVDLYLERLLAAQLDLGDTAYRTALARQAALQWWGPGGIIAVGIALAVFALLFTRSVSRPLERIAEEAHALAGGAFNRPPVVVPESPELREVARAFNRMSDGIRDLVEDLKDKHELERRLHQEELANLSMERLLRESQLVALQSQINPHFLFNTLNSVARTARLERADRSEDLIRRLSSVLRYILRSPNRSVPLTDELTIVRDYLALQAVRFGSRLHTDVSADPAVDRVPIPPLVLQPLVENAVVYGIEPREHGGRVTVRAERTQDGPAARVRIRVSDDGAGMDHRTLRHLMQDDPDTTGDSTEGIGVLNVRARLGLFYGSAHSFSLESRPDHGTAVTIVLPLEVPAQDHELQHSDRR